MNRRKFTKTAVLGGVLSLSGCSQSEHTYEELLRLEIDNEVPAGECHVYTFVTSYTSEIEYEASISRPEEGYANSNPVNILIMPEPELVRREGIMEGVLELNDNILSNYFEVPSELDVDTEVDGQGTIPPGWNTLVIDNTEGETSVGALVLGNLFRSKQNHDSISCESSSEDSIEVRRLDFYKSPPTFVLDFYFRVHSPESESYNWEITVSTKTAETSIKKEVDAECVAHFAGNRRINPDELNELEESGERLLIQINARGDKDKYSAKKWIKLI